MKEGTCRASIKHEEHWSSTTIQLRSQLGSQFSLESSFLHSKMENLAWPWPCRTWWTTTYAEWWTEPPPPMSLSPLKLDGTLPIVTLHFFEPFLTTCCCSEMTLRKWLCPPRGLRSQRFCRIAAWRRSGEVTIVLLLMFGGAHRGQRQPQMECLCASGN